MSDTNTIIRNARRDLWGGLLITALGAGQLGRSSVTLFAPEHHAHRSHEVIAIVLAAAIIAAGLAQFISGIRMLARAPAEPPGT